MYGHRRFSKIGSQLWGTGHPGKNLRACPGKISCIESESIIFIYDRVLKRLLASLTPST